MNLNHVKNQRGLPFVKKGMRVEIITKDGSKAGKITGGNESGNIDVKFEGTKYSVNCHPKYNIRYFDNDGNVLAEFID